jgi:hypothetical protein
MYNLNNKTFDTQNMFLQSAMKYVPESWNAESIVDGHDKKQMAALSSK